MMLMFPIPLRISQVVQNSWDDDCSNSSPSQPSSEELCFSLRHVPSDILLRAEYSIVTQAPYLWHNRSCPGWIKFDRDFDDLYE